MNSHIAGVVKAQALVRGVLQRLRLKRDPKYQRLFRPQPELHTQGRYDRGTMWDLEKGDLVEYSERRYNRRKRRGEAATGGETALPSTIPVTESTPLDQDAVDQPSPYIPEVTSLQPVSEAANPPIDLESASPTSQPEAKQQERAPELLYSRVNSSPEPETSPQTSFLVWKLTRVPSAVYSEPELASFPPLKPELAPLPPQSEAAEPPQSPGTTAKVYKSLRSVTDTDSKESDPPSHFHRRANSYRSYHESSAALPPPAAPARNAESPVSADMHTALFCRTLRLDMALQPETDPLQPQFPISKPETPVHGEGDLITCFGEVSRPGRIEEAEEREVIPVQTEFPLVKSETPPLSPQQPSLSFRILQSMPLSADLQEEFPPEPTYFPPVKPETPVHLLAFPSLSFQKVPLPQRPADMPASDPPIPTVFPMSKPETPVSSQATPSQSFQASPNRLQHVEKEELVPVQPAFPRPSLPVMKPETPVIKPETPVASQPAPSHVFPSISPISRAATPSHPEVPPVPSSSRAKSPVTSLFFQPRPAPLQPSTLHSSHFDTPSDRTPSFPPSLHNSSRRAGEDTPKDNSLINPANTAIAGSLSASFRSFGKQESEEKRPGQPPLIMQGADYRTSNGKIRSKSHTREWSMPQPDTFKSSLPAKSLLRDTALDPRSLSRGRRHHSNRTKTPEQRLLRLISPYDPSWNKRVLEKVFRIGVEVRLRPNAYLPDLIIRRLRRNGTRDLQPARMRELEEMELL